MTMLFEEWLSSGEDWRTSQYIVQLQRTERRETMGARRWMTREQISAKYESDEVADQIILEKTNNPAMKNQMKPHPDVPNNAAAEQHMVKLVYGVWLWNKSTSSIFWIRL